MSRAGGSRVLIVVVLVLSLAAAGVMRSVSERQRRGAQPTGSAAVHAEASINQLNSYALALLLGGLRGPLVMVLWSSSESQKAERDLEDFDTKVELIRLLQPEFDTVHIFQIWNKAYNVSAQLASLANKYAAIIDAIDYAERVLQQRPDNTNVVYQLGTIYGEKLGDSHEKHYYAERVRQETRTDAPAAAVREGDPAWRRQRLDRMVDDQGYILPHLLQVTRERPSFVPADKPYITGEELQFLKEYQPFPQGIPPLALGYNYFKKAQVLMDSHRLRHSQIADSVVDRRPAIALSVWGKDELAWGRRREMELLGLGQQASLDEAQLDLLTSEAPLAAQRDLDQALLAKALDHYTRATQVSEHAEREYQRFLTGGRMTVQPLEAHVDDLRMRGTTAQADAEYLRALAADSQARRERAAVAATAYQTARGQVYRILMAYYVPMNIAAMILPEGVDRTNLSAVPAADLPQYVQQAFQIMSAAGVDDPLLDQRQQYLNHLERIDRRLQQIAAVLGEGQSTAGASAP